ncbi:hypothetical protein M378DRAFT_951726 [Amanita muscaria Koide BX008]|uniref:Uncharacterized protein n=1 Tax=Amanita muscaria (strain Koide BX008) TaxID=946122 RepID=A0A0C2WV71_AMAMK|nr:hypothetical protein M378DRAFT_951726 [Amanita muscaria Koide BX008]
MMEDNHLLHDHLLDSSRIGTKSLNLANAFGCNCRRVCHVECLQHLHHLEILICTRPDDT